MGGTSDKLPNRYLQTRRLEALTDGTLAIIITILALLLEPPAAHETVGDLLPALIEMWHDIAAFAVTFVLVGLYWLHHHRIFSHIKRTDLPLIWLNLLFLLSASIVPFVTGLVLEYPDLRLAILLYGGAHLLTSVLLLLLWLHVKRQPALLRAKSNPQAARDLHRRLPLVPMLYALARLCAPFALLAAKALFVAVPVAIFLPQLWNRSTSRTD